MAEWIRLAEEQAEREREQAMQDEQQKIELAAKYKQQTVDQNKASSAKPSRNSQNTQ